MEQKHSSQSTLKGLYADGKKVPTLVRETTSTRVAVVGKRGKAARRVVKTTGNKLRIQDHYPIISEPGSEYVTHVTPKSGTGRDLSLELEAVVREREQLPDVAGMDGCSTNTGIHNGCIRLLEINLNRTLQWSICGLHLTELLFWHVLSDVDGVTSGPEKLKGPIGSTLHTAVWEEPVVAFKPVTGKVTALPDDVIKDLSRDQKLGYLYCMAVQTGIMPDELPSQVIGPMVTSRWNTTATRLLCKYTRTQWPTKKMTRLVEMVLMLYYPGWFQFKSHPHIQDGAKNCFYLVELSRDLHPVDMNIAQSVLSHNSYWAHPENITIGMLSDEREELRHRAVLWIQKARQEFNPETHPRQFVPPSVNFQVVARGAVLSPNIYF